MTKAARKSTRSKKKKATGRGETKAPVNLQELRERVRRVVADEAETMTKAAAEEAAKGHVAQLKYLFEVIGLYPATKATDAEPVDSNDLARVLLTKFEFPHTLPAEEEDEDKVLPTTAGSDSVK